MAPTGHIYRLVALNHAWKVVGPHPKPTYVTVSGQIVEVYPRRTGNKVTALVFRRNFYLPTTSMFHIEHRAIKDIGFLCRFLVCLRTTKVVLTGRTAVDYTCSRPKYVLLCSRRVGYGE